MRRHSRREYLTYLSATGICGGLAGCSALRDSAAESTTVSRTETSPTKTTSSVEKTETASDDPVFDTSVSYEENATVGDQVAVTVTVENVGEADGTTKLVLGANGEPVDSTTVAISTGETKTVSLEATVEQYPSDGAIGLSLNDESIGKITIGSASEVEGVPVMERGVIEKTGASYVGPKYRIHDETDVLNDGARSLEDLGTRVFKGWLDKVDVEYPFADWPDYDSLVEIADHSRFRELLNRDFETYVFVANAYTPARERGGGGYFYHEFSSEDARAETKAFYELTKYLLETYDGTGTEFVLQNWEGDWIVVGGAGEEGPPEPDVLERAKRWFNARQRGIVRARREVESDVAVLGACEINRVREPIEEGREWIVNTVLSDLNVDLVSYSAWDLCRHVASNPTLTEEVRAAVHDTLDYIESNVPESNDYVESALGEDAKRVYVGEYGMALQRAGIDRTMRAVRAVTEEALAWGAPYTLFWTTYDNEVVVDGERLVVDPNIESILSGEFDGRPGIEDVMGHYLYRPDGSRAPMWFYFAELFGTHENEYIRVDLDFETVVSSAKLNPDISEGDGRDLAFGCSELEFEASTGRTTLNIGTVGNEAALAKGVFPPEETTDRTFRWFGRPDGETTVYVHRGEHSLSGPIEQMWLIGSGAIDGLDAEVRIDGTTAGTVQFADDWKTYDIDLESQ